ARSTSAARESDAACWASLAKLAGTGTRTPARAANPRPATSAQRLLAATARFGEDTIRGAVIWSALIVALSSGVTAPAANATAADGDRSITFLVRCGDGDQKRWPAPSFDVHGHT